jgi:prevent-host-death family protein
MIRTTASQFKAKLCAYMRAVREGKEVLVTDRDRPVARFVPAVALSDRSAVRVVAPRDPTAPRLGDVRVRPIHYRGPSTTAILQEERNRR